VLLIAVFLVVAFFAIKHFLEVRKTIETGVFIDDLQKEIDSAWNSQSSSKTFSRSMDSRIEYVCFADLNKNPDKSLKDKEGKVIFDELKKNAVYANNFFFYPQRYSDIPSVKISHVDMEFSGNPNCIENKNSKIEIKIEKGFFDALVKVSGAG